MTGLAWAGVGAGAVAASYVGARTLWYAIQNPRCSWFVSSVTRGTSTRPSLALTFDDGPSESTPEILAVLDRHRVRATFFQVGANVERLPEVAREVAAASHEVGNHTHSHARLCFKSRRFIYSELATAQRIIEETIDQPVRFFRPPFGLRWFSLDRVQRQLGLTSVLWTTVGYDWKAGESEIIARVAAGVTNGAIILLHDGRRLHTTPDVSATIGALDRLIPQLQDRGFHFETLSQIIEASPCPKLP